MTGLLDYVPGNSFLHRLNPLTKLILAFGLCASCFAAGRIPVVLGIMALDMALAGLGGVFNRSLRTFLSLVKLSLILFAAQVLFVREGAVLFSLPLGLRVTEAGLRFSLLFVSRLIAATLPLTLMLSVTRMSDISSALNRRLRIPYKYTFALTTAIRFIPLFAAEMEAIIEAQIARGVDFDTKNFFKKIRLLLPLCVPLLVSSVRRIEEGAISAELRGFNFRGPASAYKRYPMGKGDWIALLALAAVIVAAALL
ncbi:MAG: energy-coupling factor transporter transmembrane protein EcfT [Treponema sp.]|jgi:energy-coupling factor transport system permease protein|nr:energy-coupling factor transporter transmembrane protein EcfT [Treponema sp.]